VKRLDLAAGWARQLAEHLPVKKHNYDRELMKKFQSAAGLVPDGVYGPKTAGALRWFTLDPKTGKGREIPPFTGGQPAPYLPPF
jgi:peptidoglycan hydrolase-like protein with peptidoglycan-binding domain